MARLLIAAAMVSACAPALDWREIRPDAAGLRASFPCRPQQQVRSLPLAGQAVTLSLYLCEAEGVTLAVAHADVGDPARVSAALQALREAAQANLGATQMQPVTAFQVPGMTPQPASGRWRLQGRRQDGLAVHEDLAVFSRGTQVVQAAVLGKALPDTVVGPFFEGLRFAP